MKPHLVLTLVTAYTGRNPYITHIGSKVLVSQVRRLLLINVVRGAGHSGVRNVTQEVSTVVRCVQITRK